MPDGASRNPKRGRIKSLAVNLAVVKSKPVDHSAGFGFLMVPETGLEPVRMISPTVFKFVIRRSIHIHIYLFSAF